MNRLIIKYSLFWTVLTIITSGLTWLIVSFMPDSGWLYWTSIVYWMASVSCFMRNSIGRIFYRST